ncbi:MAG: NADH:flavin oxidoreductase [Planctomycetota bacterium]|jgi:2,4-dienoyl-CoA reductase-like NADH-dependent reductase (Old Yellow Enzyme family)
MAAAVYKKIASLKTASDFLSYVDKLGISLPFDENVETGENTVLNQPIKVRSRVVGNRFCVLPMEGWDCTEQGSPSELTKRRWLNFGLSGCKLIWGLEACAVNHEGKGNPRQLLLNERTVSDIANLRKMLQQCHEEHYESGNLLIGLQLTHSGRYSCPNDNSVMEPKIIYNHPILDKRLGLGKGYQCLSDDQIDEIIQHFIKAALLAKQAGFDFVDIKHCHGYLGHELLSAFTRKGRYGGSIENRTRFLRDIISGIQSRVKQLMIGVRISIFDVVPFKKNKRGIGEPEPFEGNYSFAFGGDGTGLGVDLTETIWLLDMLCKMGVNLVCVTAGSPYYSPHIQRPAMYPPSDGYLPCENPLVEVSRLIEKCGELKQQKPEMIFVGSGYTYLQEWIPNVAQSVVRRGLADFIGLGRMMLSYPEIAHDILSSRPLDPKRICRTFSECTTGPRNGLVSGCYSLDDFYKHLPEAETLKLIKRTI